MKRIFKVIVISLLFLLSVNQLRADPDPVAPPTPGAQPGGGAIIGEPIGGCVNCPIDDGWGILLLAGLGYAAWKIRNLSRKKEVEPTVIL